jgi:acyl carrier protein
MDEHPLLPLLREIVSDVTGKPPSAISATDSLSELEIDSITVAEIIARVEDALEIDIPASQWLQMNTLQEILELLEQREFRGASTRTNPSTSAQ